MSTTGRKMLHSLCAEALDGLAGSLEEAGADFPLRTVIVRNPAHGPECYSIVTNEPDEVADRIEAAIRGARHSGQP